MIGVSQRSGTIMAVSLRLLYLVFDKLLRWLALLGPTTSSKGIELLLLRHDDRAAACGPVDLTPATPSLPLRSVGTSIEEQVDTSATTPTAERLGQVQTAYVSSNAFRFDILGSGCQIDLPLPASAHETGVRDGAGHTSPAHR